jgi:hypothetical protein
MRDEHARDGMVARSLHYSSIGAQGGLRSSVVACIERRRFFFGETRALVPARLEGGLIVSDVLGMLIGVGPIVAALLWSGRRDRLRQRANRVRAEINAAANGVLGGESVLSVRVEPRGPWRAGRVHLSAPGGYEFLIASVSGAVIARLPARYELVVHRG